MAKIVEIVSIYDVKNINNEGFLCMCMVINEDIYQDIHHRFPSFECLNFYFYEHDGLIQLVHAENFSYLYNSLANAGKINNFLSTFTNEEKLLVEIGEL